MVSKELMKLWTYRFDQLRHPLRIWNYLGQKIAYRFGWKKVPFSPVAIDIEPTNTCNFKCQHCQVTHWDKKKAFLDENTFVNILNQFPYLSRIKLQGMGEPLLNKNLFSMLKAAEEREISIHFNSNGSLCNEEKAKHLAFLKKTEITFSLDGATPETFENIRIGGKLEKIKQNIKYLTQVRGTKRTPTISAWTVINNDNIKELPKIVELASDLGLDKITLQPFLSNWGKETMNEYIDSIRTDSNPETLTNALKEAEKVAQEKQIAIEINQHNFYSKTKKCPWVWKNTYICSNGDVVPCAIIGDSDVVKMGNIFEQDFADIWNSDKYQELRQRIKTNNLPEHCKNCYLNSD
jgi:radical SAM protein with 4Fe4S-binding SPASM domain